MRTLMCLLAAFAILGLTGCSAKPVDEPAYYTRKMDNGVWLFEINPRNQKCDINSFLNALNAMLEANPGMEVRALTPIVAGKDQHGNVYYNILVTTAQRGVPTPDAKPPDPTGPKGK